MSNMLFYLAVDVFLMIVGQCPNNMYNLIIKESVEFFSSW